MALINNCNNIMFCQSFSGHHHSVYTGVALLMPKTGFILIFFAEIVAQFVQLFYSF